MGFNRRYKKLTFMILLICFLMLLLWVGYSAIPELKSKDKFIEKRNLTFSLLKIESSLSEYYKNCHKYPSTEEGLDSLLSPGPCLKKNILLKHQLQNDYSVKIQYTSFGNRYKLISSSQNQTVEFEAENGD